ncbi:MAG: Flp pilus assembly complex ATPase component TadA, partial [Opitutales bacterium]|nr:Flp pilus assembly complex ATPase component TadA [Opitutales bacterium]
MFNEHSETLKNIFEESGLVSREQLDEAWDEHAENGKAFTDILEDAGYLDRNTMLELIARNLNVEFVPAIPEHIDPDLLRIIKPDLAHKYGIIPFRADPNKVWFLAKDPLNYSIVDDLSFSLRRDVELVVSDPAQIDGVIVKFYGEQHSSIEDILSEIDLDNVDADDSANQAPIIRFVDVVLQEAVKAKASDIHFEPFEDQFRIRYRIDGALYEMAPPQKSLANAVTARVKVMSGLNIAEKRIPQDGRIKTTIGGRPIDLRVSTLPTQFGESVVLRILDKGVVNLDLENLSMEP